jgi:hypothetical protein
MKQLCTYYGGRIAVIEIEGVRYLSLRLTAGRKSFSLTRFSTVKNSPGYEITGGSVREWYFSGTCEIEGSVYFYGPFRKGVPVHTLFAGPAGGGTSLELLEKLGKLHSVFALLPDTARPVFANGLLIDFETGNALCLPPGVVELAAEEMDARERDTILYHYYFPEKSREENYVFLLGAAGYFLCTGMLLENSSPETDFRTLLANREAAPPELVNPYLRLEISELFLDSIYTPAAVPLSRFPEVFTAVKTAEDSEIPREEIIRRKAEMEQRREQQQKRHLRAEFLRKNGWKILLIAVIGIIGGVLGGRMIYRASLPPITAGMSEEDVIRLFYRSYGSLDHEMMEKCVAKGGGADEIERGLNLFVISRVRQAYEGRDTFIPAADWVAGGKQPLRGDPLIFGITDLSVEHAGGNVYLAKYTEYLPGRIEERETAEAENAAALPLISQVTERVTLTYIDGAWLISEIRELSREPISTD